jgi:hypothetical protein
MILAQKFGSLNLNPFSFTSQPQPNQHDLHGPDESQTTIDYHHLDESRDDGVDEQEIHWHLRWLMDDLG